LRYDVFRVNRLDALLKRGEASLFESFFDAVFKRCWMVLKPCVDFNFYIIGNYHIDIF